MKLLLAGAAALLVASPALAQKDDGPRFCPNRPSLGSSACTTDPGHVQVEASALDWQLDSDRDSREDTVIAGDLLARIGITPSTEVQVGWTSYGQVRTRDRATGLVDTDRGTGDVLVGVRQNLRNPDGSGFSFGIQPQVTLPTGGSAIGAGDWGAGVLAPVTYDLAESLNLQFTPEVDAAVDEDRHGRHFAASGILGLAWHAAEQVTLNGEFQLEQDDDPMGHQTRAAAAASIAWQPRKGVQFDLLGVAGLNRDTPDVRIVTGGAFLF